MLKTNQKTRFGYVPPVVRPIEITPERFVMGSPVSNPGFPGVDVYEDQF